MDRGAAKRLKNKLTVTFKDGSVWFGIFGFPV